LEYLFFLPLLKIFFYDHLLTASLQKNIIKTKKEYMLQALQAAANKNLFQGEVQFLTGGVWAAAHQSASRFGGRLGTIPRPTV